MQVLLRKLSAFTRLSAEDEAALARLVEEGRVRHYGARQDVVREGERPRDVHAVLLGWACRYKQLADGRRQIVAYFLPGDLCDLNVYILRRMDHSVGTITPAVLVELPRARLEALTLDRPRIMQALWWETLVNAAVQREWSLNLGQRTALERVAHLLCELFVRLRVVGLTRGDRCELPVTQVELADTTGMSAVHVNRTLQELRGAGLITLHGGALEIPDFAGLCKLGMFNADYLHLGREGRDLDARE